MQLFASFLPTNRFNTAFQTACSLGKGRAHPNYRKLLEIFQACFGYFALKVKVVDGCHRVL